MNDSNTSIIIDEIYEKLLVKNFLVIGLYVPVFITALLANVLVVWVVIKEQYMRRSSEVQLDQNSLAYEMRTRGNERVSVRQGYGYGCRPNRQVRSANGRDFSPLRHSPSCSGRPVDWRTLNEDREDTVDQKTTKIGTTSSKWVSRHDGQSASFLSKMSLKGGGVTNYFLVNLSIADLFVALVCMPNAAYAAYTSVYSFGEYACKISAYLQCVSVASSIFTITAMAVDRYLAITRPFGFFYRCFNKRTTTIIILLMWILSLALFMPVLLVTGTSKLEYIEVQNKSLYINVHFCGEHWEKSSMSPVQQALGITWFIFMFVLPGLIILFAYSMMSRTLCSGVPPFDNNDGVTCMQQRNRLMRSRKRVACILLLLAFIFAGCWLPYHVVNLLGDVGNDNYKELTMYLLLLGHANSALNPVIYCALSRRFRNSIKDLICVDIHFTRRRQNMQIGFQFREQLIVTWGRIRAVKWVCKKDNVCAGALL
ncbi:hypothetical protein GEV33_009594 [Tenebrio molitor]|uniref:G-protein coupled receptors family 1 profile domain-containing protein n=1 Tax=Tenebrio molitor TaxID=7067 RepID=A0A8J6HFG4_TENMO|nr:hypothetical protein GEV33_009594 [Tenebrio molitor]